MNNKLFLLSTVEDMWDGFMEMDAGVLFFVLVVFAVILIPLFRYLNGKKIIQADDNGISTIIECKVIEKRLEQVDAGLGVKIPVEYITVETQKGERKQLRNVKIQAFGILDGDYAKIELRNNTIYGYRRLNKDT